jgi:HK97 family phage portal protein
MRASLKPLVQQTIALARALQARRAPGALLGGQWAGTSFVDSWKRTREPTPNELMAELRGAAWTCASINAAVCASFPPRLYVRTLGNQPGPKCLTRPVSSAVDKRLRSAPHLLAHTKQAEKLEEVTDHPVLDLLAQVNPSHNGFDLWELTTLYLEVHGRAYWYLDIDPTLGIPREIWPLPAQNVTPARQADSANLIDFFEYRSGKHTQQFAPEEVVFFHYPDPRDPYLGGLSPLRACFEQVTLTSEYAATKSAIYENRGVPSALVTPDEVIGEEERDRLESQWNQKFRRGGSGRVVVAESSMKLQLLSQSMGDLAALADLKATKEDIYNAFHVPIAFGSSETNLANLQAAEHQHMAKAIGPRLRRRDEKLNEQLVPLYDPSRRLFFASEDPVPVNHDMAARDREIDLKYGVLTINEIRNERGLPRVPWGDEPLAPLQPGAGAERETINRVP